jgi:hypothetical protein
MKVYVIEARKIIQLLRRSGRTIDPRDAELQEELAARQADLELRRVAESLARAKKRAAKVPVTRPKFGLAK